MSGCNQNPWSPGSTSPYKNRTNQHDPDTFVYTSIHVWIDEGKDKDEDEGKDKDENEDKDEEMGTRASTESAYVSGINPKLAPNPHWVSLGNTVDAGVGYKASEAYKEDDEEEEAEEEKNVDVLGVEHSNRN